MGRLRRYWILIRWCIDYYSRCIWGRCDWDYFTMTRIDGVVEYYRGCPICGKTEQYPDLDAWLYMKVIGCEP